MARSGKQDACGEEPATDYPIPAQIYHAKPKIEITRRRRLASSARMPRVVTRLLSESQCWYCSIGSAGVIVIGD